MKMIVIHLVLTTTWYTFNCHFYQQTTPGNWASLGKQFIVTMFVDLAKMMKQIFVSSADIGGNDM